MTKARKIKLTEGSQNAVRQKLDALQDQFGRDAGPEDQVFFDALSTIPDQLEVDWLQIEFVRLMRKARIPAELIYAYLRTGLIVTEERYEHLSREDRYAWDSAIVEYVLRSKRSPKKRLP
jgi:hypothetical protein